MSKKTLTGRELGILTGTTDAPEVELRRVSSIEDSGPDAIVFAEDDATVQRALASDAGAIFTRANAAAGEDPRLLRVRDPRYAFALAGKALSSAAEAPLIHASATLDPTAKLGARTRIGAGVIIEADAVIGDDVVIASGAKVLHGVQIGHRCLIQSGAVLGSLGFGYVRNNETGEYLLFPQQGALIIEDDVEIGANTTIDRGALGETRIGRGTKIDNLVHIGHNCRIGKNVIIAAQVGISGSCTIEDGAILAGQVGISDHCHIGPGVILGGQAGVYRGATVTGPNQAFAGTPAEPLKDHLKSLARLRRLK